MKILSMDSVFLLSWSGGTRLSNGNRQHLIWLTWDIDGSYYLQLNMFDMVTRWAMSAGKQEVIAIDPFHGRHFDLSKHEKHRCDK